MMRQQPTPAMQSYAQELAEKSGIELPESHKDNFLVCRNFLNEHAPQQIDGKPVDPWKRDIANLTEAMGKECVKETTLDYYLAQEQQQEAAQPMDAEQERERQEREREEKQARRDQLTEEERAQKFGDKLGERLGEGLHGAVSGMGAGATSLVNGAADAGGKRSSGGRDEAQQAREDVSKATDAIKKAFTNPLMPDLGGGRER